MEIRSRKGKIKLLRDVVLSMDKTHLSLLFSNFFPFSIENNETLTGAQLTYFGISKWFEKIKEGDEIPFYEAQISTDEKSGFSWIAFIKT